MTVEQERRSVFTVSLLELVNLQKECNRSPSSCSVQVTVRFIEPRTYFMDFWQLPPSGFAVCRDPAALCAALKDECSVEAHHKGGLAPDVAVLPCDARLSH